ncbi:hypothetical protein [Undibacterium sp. Tian12W]|uniref:DUF3108 domain-containing protein n=1 Tax=Undibacterium sp. Tian12W TaxID=3413054 RepID=UPI003BF3648A
MRSIVFPALALLFASFNHAQAATETLSPGKTLSRIALLKDGTHHYLRYFKSGDSNVPVDIWSREVQITEQNGEKRIRIRQRWDGAAIPPSAPVSTQATQANTTAATKLLDSWAQFPSFTPISHERITDKDGKHLVEGFTFSADKITGMKDLADNSQKDFVMPSAVATYNFETDIEFLQTLPLAAGYEARVNFYHPGSTSAPAYYSFKVAGEESIAGPAGNVDCWLVTTDYNRPGTVTKFWFAKQSQIMLRQEATMPDGRTLVKTLID